MSGWWKPIAMKLGWGCCHQQEEPSKRPSTSSGLTKVLSCSRLDKAEHGLGLTGTRIVAEMQAPRI